MSEGPSFHVRIPGRKNQDRCRHPRENLNGTYDGMFPAPNAWTPFPERQKAKRTNNIKRRVVLLRAMVADDRELLSLCTIRSRVALQNAMPQSPTAPILKGVGCGGPVFIPSAGSLNSNDAVSIFTFTSHDRVYLFRFVDGGSPGE